MIYRRGPQSQGSPYPQRIVNGNTFGWGGQGSQPGFGDSASLKSCPFCPSRALGSGCLAGWPHWSWSFHRLSTHREVEDHPLRGHGAEASHQEGGLPQREEARLLFPAQTPSGARSKLGRKLSSSLGWPRAGISVPSRR